MTLSDAIQFPICDPKWRDRVRAACREERPRSAVARNILRIRAHGEVFARKATNAYIEPLLKKGRRDDAQC